MPDNVNRQWRLRSRPMGEATAENFELAQSSVPPAGEGEVLRRTLFLSVDPYMRGRMNAGKSYAKAVEIGEVMCGGTVSQVVKSNDPAFAEGDIVLGYDGWQEYGVSKGEALLKLDPSGPPVSYYLGVLGMPGMTAYVGMLDIAAVKAGDSVLVSAAAGAVGSVAGQIAKIKGARVIGSAGSDEKCRWVTRDLGFDACFNYKTEPLRRAMKKNFPEGIDVYFDNVGGEMLEMVLRHARLHARIAIIGMISQYNAPEPAPGPSLFPILVNRMTIRGMIVWDHKDRQEAFHRDMAAWLKEGKVRYREDVVDGFENIPAAFLGLFHGENIGKRVVKL